mmetsp:Transcript_2714/g.5825  ORF Transcript_2714/g.5825 Transcript_2714/m.5825 type:complete len:231 (+) Transcript_2714:1014-1706(+)
MGQSVAESNVIEADAKTAVPGASVPTTWEERDRTARSAVVISLVSGAFRTRSKSWWEGSRSKTASLPSFCHHSSARAEATAARGPMPCRRTPYPYPSNTVSSLCLLSLSRRSAVQRSTARRCARDRDRSSPSNAAESLLLLDAAEKEAEAPPFTLGLPWSVCSTSMSWALMSATLLSCSCAAMASFGMLVLPPLLSVTITKDPGGPHVSPPPISISTPTPTPPISALLAV